MLTSSDSLLDDQGRAIVQALCGLPPYDSPLSKRRIAREFGVNRYTVDEVERAIKGESRPKRSGLKESYDQLGSEESEAYLADRDAGIYAEILHGLRQPETRGETIDTLAYNLLVGAAQRNRTRTRAEKSVKKLRLSGDKPIPEDERHETLGHKRAYNELLDSHDGHNSLIAQLIEKAEQLQPARAKLLPRIIERGERAQKALQQIHSMLVIFTAHQVQKSLHATSINVLPLDAGYRGLYHAVRHFDPQMGFAFSPYAVRTIHGAILNAYNDERAQKLNTSRTYLDRARKVQKIESELAQKLGATPTDEAIAEALGVKDAAHVQELREILQRSYTVPLGGLVGGSGNSKESLSDVLDVQDSAAADAYHQTHLGIALETIFNAVELTEDELTVLHGSFGVSPYTHALGEKELGEIVGVPVKNIRYLFRTARKKLLQSTEASTILAGYIND